MSHIEKSEKGRNGGKKEGRKEELEIQKERQSTLHLPAIPQISSMAKTKLG